MFSKALTTTLLYVFSVLLLFNGTVLGAVPPSKTKLVFYYGPKFTDSISVNLSDAAKVLQHPAFMHNETHCYLHGIGEDQNGNSIRGIFDAYMKRNTINLLTIDWAEAAAEKYFSASRNIETLAPALADMILNLFNAGLKRDNFTVVAHSLGAQLAGLTGRHIIKNTNGTVKIYRLAILDGAFPLFLNTFSLETVNKNDAEFVEAIHTDIGTSGPPKSLGHVDFWPNGGLQGQPGCPQGMSSKEDICSHQRSWRFWAESVANVNGPMFWAFPSSSYSQLLIHGIENLKDKSIQMGYNCPQNARGDYYLKTNSAPPFAMGFDGY